MRMSFAFAGFCMSLKNSVRALRISGGTGIAAATAELVPLRDRGRTRLADVIAGLLHELLLRQSSVRAFY